ncbi:hypothetical protein DMENIID0001_020260 [Sergentomyia squamirostris]
MSGEEVCIICKRKIPKGSKHGFHYSVSKHMALWHGKFYDIRTKTMLALVESYKKRARKQNREGPEEEPDSTAGLQLQAAAIELSDQNSLNDVGSEDQQQSRQVEGEAPPGSSRVKKNKFSSLPAASKESLQRLLKRMDDKTSSKDCKQEVVPMPRINATEEHMDVDVLPPPPPAPTPAAPVPVNDDYRIHVINRFVDLALGLYRQ